MLYDVWRFTERLDVRVPGAVLDSSRHLLVYLVPRHPLYVLLVPQQPIVFLIGYISITRSIRLVTKETLYLVLHVLFLYLPYVALLAHLGFLHSKSLSTTPMTSRLNIDVNSRFICITLYLSLLKTFLCYICRTRLSHRALCNQTSNVPSSNPSNDPFLAPNPFRTYTIPPPLLSKILFHTPRPPPH